MYKCAICGKEYEDPEKYVECSQRCVRVMKDERERKRKERLAEEKDARYEGIIALQNKIKSDKKMLEDMKDRFIEDYPEDKHIQVENMLSDMFDNVFRGWC